jgi:hypothetical protein
MLTKEQRLILYQKALKDYKGWYKRSKFQMYLDRVFYRRIPLYLKYGFCGYFGLVHKTNLGSLPELKEARGLLGPPKRGSYWYKPGDLEPRIKVLELVIKICKDDEAN